MQASRLVFGLVCLLSFGAATAQTTSTATIGRISYQLVDLDLDDGITPSLTFVPGTTITAPSSFSIGFNNSGSWMSVLGAHEQAPITIADTQGTVSAQGILTSTGSLASLEITAVANAAGDGSFAYKRATVQGGSGRTNFQLSPMTAVIFTAQSVLTGRTTQGGDWAVASAWIDLETYIDGEPVSTQNYKSLNSYYDLPFGSDVFTETQHDTLQVTYANTSLGITETAFGAGVYGNADSFLTPVPEPSVYAMLMAGLGLVACVSRRRGRSAT